MKEELLEEYIRQQFDATTDDTLFFLARGPTLAGLEFYRRQSPFRKNASAERAQRYPDQRNRLDEAWCRF